LFSCFIYFPAEAARSFSLLAQRKQNQKKGHPTIGSLRDSPALLAFIGAKINSLRSNKFLLNPMKAAMLGCIEGMKVKTKPHVARRLGVSMQTQRSPVGRNINLAAKDA
jgi:hypothetical protein